jgi:hypothetical protein
MESFSSHEAARVLAKAQTYEEGLRQRTEGITQMVWGTVTSAMFVSYGFAAVLEASELVFSLLWMPWIALGSIITYALWRSAALVNQTAPFARLSRPLLRMVLLIAAISAIFAVKQPEGPTLALGMTGFVWAAMAAVNVFRGSQRGRFLWALCGLAMLAAAAALAFWDAPVETAGSVSILVPAVVPLATGLWQTLQD